MKSANTTTQVMGSVCTMTEEFLDKVCEELWLNKEYGLLASTLEPVETTYSKFEHYMKRLDKVAYKQEEQDSEGT